MRGFSRTPWLLLWAFYPETTAFTEMHSPSRAQLAISRSQTPLLHFSFSSSEEDPLLEVSLEKTLSEAMMLTSLEEANSRQRKQPRSEEQHLQWLRQATESLILSTPGTLVKGKWHEVVSILSAWLDYSKTLAEAPLQMEALLKRLVEERQGGNEEVQLNIRLYNLVIDAWVSSALFHTHGAEASQRARELLVTLQENYEETKDPALKPDAQSFQAVLHGVCKTEHTIHVRRLLAWMVYLYKSGKNTAAQLRRCDYIKILDAYANSGEDNAGLLVEACMRQMQYLSNIQPDTVCYNIAIKAYSRSKKGREAAEHAHRILETMKAPPDIFTYTSVISAWAASGMKSHAVSRAEEILRHIENETNMEANTVALNAVMSAWVKSRNPAAVHRTHEIIRQMELSNSAQPDLISYNTLLHALSMHAKKNPAYARRADDFLHKLEQGCDSGKYKFAPSTFTYNLVIEACCRSGMSDSTTRAADVLRRMIKRPGVEPDTFSFNQVLSAFSKSGAPGAAKAAEQLLLYMEESYKTGLHPHAKPDNCSYSSVISTYARSGEQGAAFAAEQLLKRMQKQYEAGESDVKPCRVCYNALIDCWAKSGEGTFAARKAESILQYMQQQYLAGDESLGPNLITFNAVLNAWARSGTRCCARKAEQYLNQMWELYHAGNKKVKPNDFSYNTVINAISKSKDERKAQKALRLLRRMDKLYQAGITEARPNEVTYTAVLNSCAFPSVLDSKARRRILDVAMFTLQELQASRYGQPNQVTYGTFIKACANLLPHDDDLLRVVLKRTFEQCCRDGQVGEMVLTHLRRAAPPDLYEELLSSVGSKATAVSVQDLPLAWRCNLPKETRRSSKPNSRATRNEQLKP